MFGFYPGSHHCSSSGCNLHTIIDPSGLQAFVGNYSLLLIELSVCALGSPENEFVTPFFMGQPNKCAFLDPECPPPK